tara:strand:+ start:2207 stop:3796 length:1590 start_codon:yes stop_codon:yes gene_type:complete
MGLDQHIPTPDHDKPVNTVTGERINTKDFMQFVPGTVVKVNNGDDWPITDSSNIGAVWAMPHFTTDPIRKETFIAKDDTNKYIPLLRGVKDMPAVGELVLLTKIAGTQFYLGPLNIMQTPNRGDDPFRTNQITSGKEQGSSSDSANNPNKMLRGYKHLGKRLNIKLDNPKLYREFIEASTNPADTTNTEEAVVPPIPIAQTNIKGDMIIEGKYGNSIRLGHRNVHPNIVISNGRSVNNVTETTLDSSLFFMSKYGSIRDHFNSDMVEISPNNETSGEGNPPEKRHYSYKWTLADQNKFDLPFEAVNSITKTFSTSMGRGLGPHKDEVDGATGENDDNVEKTIYGYSRPQILINSDRVTINSKRESLFLSAAEFVHIGAKENINISTSKTILGNASTSVIFNTPLFKVNAPGKVYIDGRKNTNDKDEIVGSIFLGNPLLGDKMAPAVLGDALCAWMVMLVSEIQQICFATSQAIENRAATGASYDLMSTRADALDDLMGLVTIENDNGSSSTWPESLAKIILSDSVKIKK